MRGSGNGIRAKAAQVKENGIKAMAWISFALAIIGGAALKETFISDWTVKVFNWLPQGWTTTIGLVLFCGLLALLIRDIWVDSIPNHTALYVAIALPTVVRILPGKMSDRVSDLSQNSLDKAADAVGAWAGAAAFGIAAASIGMALVLAQRVISRSSMGR